MMIRIEVPYEPWPVDNWSEVELRIIREAREQRESTLAAYRAAGWHHWDREPRTMEHIRWLYLRICPAQGRERPMSWGDIAKTEDVDESQQVTADTVKWTVEKLARDIGITLPSAPRGRPPRLNR
ncbi:MAG: hypothetical protein Q7T33_06510 [Dehalococcoidia bacterium]|nr:hypothetical protein [Dehalococcoidia bacterium]